MARTSVERKQKSPLPWITGLVLLGLILWGIASLLTEEPAEEPQVAVATVADTHPPAAIPSPPYADPVAEDGARSLRDVAPLDQDDLGEQVRIQGEVVATGNDGFWIVVGGNVLRVDSPVRVRSGDTVSVRGTLQSADPEATDGIASSVLPRREEAAEWSVVREIKLVDDRSVPGR